MDIQDFMNAVSNAARDTRSEYHLTLGKAIEVVDKLPETSSVRFDFNNLYPDHPHSYRGYYSDLAFDFTEEKLSAGSFLNFLKGSLDTEYKGYKGGTYKMGENTPLWAANWGSCGRAIIAWYFNDDTQELILVTKEDD